MEEEVGFNPQVVDEARVEEFPLGVALNEALVDSLEILRWGGEIGVIS